MILWKIIKYNYGFGHEWMVLRVQFNSAPIYEATELVLKYIGARTMPEDTGNGNSKELIKKTFRTCTTRSTGRVVTGDLWKCTLSKLAVASGAQLEDVIGLASMESDEDRPCGNWPAAIAWQEISNPVHESLGKPEQLSMKTLEICGGQEVRVD